MPFVFNPPHSSPRGTTPTPPPRRCAISDTLLQPSRFTHHHRVLHAVLLDEEGWFVLSDLVRLLGRYLGGRAQRRCVTGRRGRWRRRNSASACSPSAMCWSGTWMPTSGGSPGSMTNATGHARIAWSASPGSTPCSGSQCPARREACAVGSAARCCHACAASPANATPQRAVLHWKTAEIDTLHWQGRDLDPLSDCPTSSKSTPADPGLTPSYALKGVRA